MEYERQKETAIKLLQAGCSVAFIARYRREQTAGLDETQLQNIKKDYEKQTKLTETKTDLLKKLEKKGVLSPALENAVYEANSLIALKEIYSIYRSSRVTKYDLAVKAGLGELAELLLTATQKVTLQRFVKAPLTDTKEAVQLAGAIIANEIAFKPEVRIFAKQLFQDKARIITTPRNIEQDKKYRDYHNFEQALKYLPSHSYLAILRAEKAKIIKVNWQLPPVFPERIMQKMGYRPVAYHKFIRQVVEKTISAKLVPSLKRELRQEMQEKAQKHALEIFAQNLKQLLLCPGLKREPILALDPGYAHGVKCVALSGEGEVLSCFKIFPHPPQKDVANSVSAVKECLATYKINILAIGNGQALRETVNFVTEAFPEKSYLIVPETGASVYSASPAAVAELPALDVSYRGAVSIGRRVFSPLDEYVKIPPEALGIGMYQHDLPAKELKNRLGEVVASCVNYVGADINTSSVFLLQHINGLTLSLANNIVEHRKINGNFQQRKELLKVKGIGAKTYEAAAGFCLIESGKNPLDSTVIHPESYEQVQKIAAFLNLEPRYRLEELKCALEKITAEELHTRLNLPYHEVAFIKEALTKRKYDPREDYPMPLLISGQKTQGELAAGSVFYGVVRNITPFGIFCDLGLKQQGLLHKSKLPVDFGELYAPGQTLKVVVENYEEERERISLKLG